MQVNRFNGLITGMTPTQILVKQIVSQSEVLIGSDASSVWNFCGRFSDVIFAGKRVVASRNVGCFLRPTYNPSKFRVQENCLV